MAIVVLIVVLVAALGALAYWLGGRAAPQERLDRAARRMRADGEADATYRGITPQGPPIGG